MNIKSHTFRLGKYRISFARRIYGLTDIPDKIVNGKPIAKPWGKTDKDMTITQTGGLAELDTCLHEALHAEGIPDRYLHDKDGNSDTKRISLFLWRLGYRKPE